MSTPRHVRVIVPVRTPVNDLRQYDGLPAAEAIVRAWAELGPRPDWHLYCRQIVRDAMPLLARAITRLMIERGREQIERELVETDSAEHGRQAEPIGPAYAYRDRPEGTGCRPPLGRSINDDWTCPQCGRVWMLRASWELVR